MLQRISFISLLSISAAAFAAPTTQTVTVQPGQGSPVVVTVPAPSTEAPYALAGNRDAHKPLQLIRVGQGEVLVEKH
jgi:hypothetical protein